MEKCLCAVLSDREDLDDPWDDLESACPEYREKMKAEKTLVSVPGGSDLGGSRIKRCPGCGAIFLWIHSFWHNGDRDRLEMMRLSPEQTRVLGPLLESNDGDVLSRSLSEAFSSPDAEMADFARFIYENLLYWKFWNSLVQVRTLLKLACEPGQAARRFACDGLICIARGESKMKKMILSEMADMKLNTDDPKIKELANVLGP